MKPTPQVFKKSVSALAICILVSLFYVKKGDARKESFQNISGSVISIHKTHDYYPGKDSSKYRYVLIDSYAKPFEIFVGKSSGDFAPTFENIDNLHPDETVTIYFEEDNKSRTAPVNNLAYFIDRGDESVFIQGNSKKFLVYGMIGFCVLFILLLLFLKKLGKII